MDGTSYNAALADDLGCELTDDGAIDVDENRETSVDGAYAGLAIHKELRRFPQSPAALETRAQDRDQDRQEDRERVDDDAAPERDDGEYSRCDPASVPSSSPVLRAQMRRVRERDASGLREPSPGRE